MTYRLGIDVGGTNTDVVLLDKENRVIAKTKTAVTSDIVTGIRTGVGRVLEQSGVDGAQISHAMLGTTQVTNAIIERRELNDVAIVRLGAPATRAVKPLAGWPDDLRAATLSTPGLSVADTSSMVAKSHRWTRRRFAVSPNR